MQFLMVIDSLDFGGAERQLILDANALARRGHGVTVGYFRSGPLEQELVPDIGREHIRAKTIPGRGFAIQRIIAHLEANLVIAHMFRAEVAVGLACIGGRVPVIFNEHGLGLWRRTFHKLALRLASLSAREIWCASEVCRKLRENQDRLDSRKLRTVYNFFDLKQASASGGQLKAEILLGLGKSLDTPIIGFVGRFDRVKRLDLLVEAAAHETLRNAVFVLVGDGAERDNLEMVIKNKGFEARFHIPGFVDRPGDYFDAFDVFALPSKRESLSIALLEAGSAKLPAVAFDVGGNAEIIMHNTTGYIVTDDDFVTFLDALGRLVKSHDLRHSMGSAAKSRVTSKFSEKRRMNEILGVAERYANKGVTA